MQPTTAPMAPWMFECLALAGREQAVQLQALLLTLCPNEHDQVSTPELQPAHAAMPIPVWRILVKRHAPQEDAGLPWARKLFRAIDDAVQSKDLPGAVAIAGADLHQGSSELVGLACPGLKMARLDRYTSSGMRRRQFAPDSLLSTWKSLGDVLDIAKAITIAQAVGLDATTPAVAPSTNRPRF